MFILNNIMLSCQCRCNVNDADVIAMAGDKFALFYIVLFSKISGACNSGHFRRRSVLPFGKLRFMEVGFRL